MIEENVILKIIILKKKVVITGYVYLQKKMEKLQGPLYQVTENMMVLTYL